MSLRFPVITATCVVLTIAAFVLAPGSDLLSAANGNTNQLFWLAVLDQQQPLQLWRLFSAHLLHTDWNHLLLNLLALAMLAGIIEQHSRRLLLIAIALGMAFVGLWFFATAPTRYYCGWSGVLNTLLLAALYTLYQPSMGAVAADSSRRRTSNAIIVIVVLGALLKNLFELYTGTSLVSAGRWQPAPGAHLAGWCAGAILVLMTSLGAWRRTLTKD